jgi:hypothetical protein
VPYKSRTPSQRAKEIDLKLDGGERFSGCECAGEGHAHLCVGNVAQDASMGRSHGIGMAPLRRQRDEGASICNFFCFKSNEPGDRNVAAGIIESFLLNRQWGSAAAGATDWLLKATLSIK